MKKQSQETSDESDGNDEEEDDRIKNKNERKEFPLLSTPVCANLSKRWMSSVEGDELNVMILLPGSNSPY